MFKRFFPLFTVFLIIRKTYGIVYFLDLSKRNGMKIRKTIAVEKNKRGDYHETSTCG